MALLTLTGEITADGQLHVTLPQDLPIGKVMVWLSFPPVDSPNLLEWTDEALTELLTSRPMTGAEIVAAGLTGGWEHLNITDSVAWVEAQRARRRSEHQ
jgi:hypothetical protein